MRLTLRLRLTLLHVLFFGVIEALLVVAFLFARPYQGTEDRDTLMLGAVSKAKMRVSALPEPRTPESIRRAIRVGGSVVECAIDRVDGSTERIETSPLFEEIPEPFGRDSLEAEAVLRPFPRQALHALDDARAVPYFVSVPFRDEAGSEYLMHAVVLDYPDSGGLIELYVIGLPASLIAAGLISWVLAGRAERPLRQLARQAAAIEPGQQAGPIDLDEDSGAAGRLQDEINRAVARLEQGHEAQAQFVGNVAHELKTPIAVMLAEAQVVRSQPRSNEEYIEFVDGVEEEMRSLGRLVESFLVLTRAERGQGLTRRVEVSLLDVLMECVSHCEGFAHLFDVRLVPSFDLHDPDRDYLVIGDPDLLRTMLDNLVRNAIKFSAAGESVDVELRCTTDRGEFSVRDRGPGIDPDAIEAIFDRFAQAGGQSPREQGTGLGLSIARSVAELHSGRLSVRNVEGGGCVFSVSLPLEPVVTHDDLDADSGSGEAAA